MAAERFDAALDRQRVARRLGDVRLRYDAELLIGEAVPPLDVPALLPDILVVVGILVGLGALAALILPQLRSVGGVWGTMGAATLAAAATLAGIRLGGLRRGRRGFVINFDRHSLRIDQPKGLRIRSATTRAAFSDVQQVQLLEREPGWCALAIQLEGRQVVLVDRVREADRGQLVRLKRLLEAAFAPGLTPPPAGG